MHIQVADTRVCHSYALEGAENVLRFLPSLAQQHLGVRMSQRQGVLVSCVIAMTLSTGAQAAAQTPSSTSVAGTAIPPQALDTALDAVHRQTGLQIVFVSSLTEGRNSHGSPAGLSAEQTLVKVLEGTGLTFLWLDAKTVQVKQSGDGALNPPSENTAELETRLAQSQQSAPPAATGEVTSSDSSAPIADSGSMQEVLVTAQKKEERLQDVPIPVSTVSAVALAENNHTRLRDYFHSIPGFIVSPGPSAGNQQMLTIRGVSSGAYGNPTVGVTVDDVPYGAFTREYAPDIDPSDLARVEVLRGPQGTLYGANSMGGLLKYVTVDPSTDSLNGRLEGGTNSVSHGSDVGYNLRGAVNIPLSDTVAVRMSGFTREDPGFVDNPALGEKDVNEVRVRGGRLSGLWKPTEDLSLKLSGLYQKTSGDGLSEVVAAPTLGQLQQNYIRGVGTYEQENQAYSAIANASLGRVDLTSVTGYNVFRYLTSNDYSYLLGGQARRLFGVTGAPTFADGGTDKFTQELRVSMPIGQRFEWLVGAFYTHEDTTLLQTFAAENTATGEVVGTIQALDIPIKLTEYAAFTDLTVHFTDRFDVQFGGRQSHLKPMFDSVTQSGALFPTSVVLPAIDNTSDVFTYLVTPRFKFSSDLMAYARIASGYRPARANSFNPDPLIPRTADPDKTKNYEVGVKGAFFDRIVSFDASLYYIDWKDLQILLFSPRNNLTYNTNGSAAKSEGVELSLSIRPLEGLTVSTWASYNNAVLTEGFPATTAAFGPERSRMPFSARFSGSLSADQRFPVSSAISGFAGVTVTNVGDRRGPFIATPARAYYPSYTTVDLRTGLEFESWKLNLFANNVSDKRVPIGGGAGAFPPTSFFYLQPRTMGLSLVKTF